MLNIEKKLIDLGFKLIKSLPNGVITYRSEDNTEVILFTKNEPDQKTWEIRSGFPYSIILTEDDLPKDFTKINCELLEHYINNYLLWLKKELTDLEAP